MSDLPTFTTVEVAAHKTRNDLWIVVHGKVYDVTEYVRDHPGGVDALIDVAGTDATTAYQDVGHSEDADEILEGYYIGQSAEGDKFKPQKSIKLVQQAPPSPVKKPSSSATPYSLGLLKVALGSVVLGASVYGASVYGSVGRQALGKLSIPTPSTMTPSPFLAGFAAAGTLSAIVAGVVGTKLSLLLRPQLESFARRYPSNFKLWLMLDQAPKKWAYGTGYVTADVIKTRLPHCASDTKIMLCGPPGMVAASQKALVSLGFQAPGAVAKMTDQIFCF
ncbi:hypothetical protein CDV31_004459 [Fusarium ambrosium]|uniref:Cytochrome b5 heme-binding domain-containing protein n=1 Tax=Fusarium ambrosium TaxID=131363 RepID=A0A428UQY4_9HYPO|nr:hypothetical protein CDV31_004459 [Fusarium ambrosium]